MKKSILIAILCVFKIGAFAHATSPPEKINVVLTRFLSPEIVGGINVIQLVGPDAEVLNNLTKTTGSNKSQVSCLEESVGVRCALTIKSLSTGTVREFPRAAVASNPPFLIVELGKFDFNKTDQSSVDELSFAITGPLGDHLYDSLAVDKSNGDATGQHYRCYFEENNTFKKCFFKLDLKSKQFLTPTAG